jgi:hypothetical protein
MRFSTRHFVSTRPLALTLLVLLVLLVAMVVVMVVVVLLLLVVVVVVVVVVFPRVLRAFLAKTSTMH